MSPIQTVRRLATANIERSPRLTGLVIRAAASIARRRGADVSIVDEARDVEDRPLERSLQILKWAAAVSGSGQFPKHFTPGDHLRTPAARRAATLALQRRLAGGDDARLQRDLIHVDDREVDGLASDVRNHLVRILDDRAARPQRGEGIDPGRQLEIVDELTHALSTVDVRPFLMSGTLLGFVRNGSFLPHDYDIDLGLVPGVDMAVVVDAVNQIGTYDVSVVGPRAVAVDPSGVVVDLFAHELRDGLFWHATYIHEWWNTPFDLVADEIDGRRVWVPDDTHRYLDENYGRWATSVPFYDISFDTPNRRYRRGVDTLRFLHSRCIIALERGDRWLLENAARELRDEFGIDVTDRLAPSALIDRA